MKFTGLFLFFCVLTLSAAPVRVALIGDGNLVDPVTAALSSDEAVELLERNQIQTVLKEHQLNVAALSAGILAQYFPHTDVFAVFTPERLVVFNAKNGFRLWDGKMENPSEKIRIAVGKTARKNPEYLSIVSVRDVGVPRSLKPKIEEMVTFLEQALVQSPEIQILERVRLNAVTDERELTGKQFALVPSAKLLTLEFEPGSESRIVNVKILIRDLGGKTLGRCTQDDSFRDIPAGVISLQTQLNALLFGEDAVAADVKAEAARFYEEYLASKDFQLRKQKLDSALALDPMNEKYRYEELLFLQERCYSHDWNVWIARIKVRLERARKFHADFPRYRSRDWNRMPVFDLIQIFQRQPFGMVYSRNNPPSQAQAAEIAALCDELRPLIRMDKKWNFYPCDPDNGIDSIVELENDINIVYRTHMKEYYGNWGQFLLERLYAYSALLRRMELFVRQHPESKAQVEQIGGFEWFEDLALGDGLSIDDAAVLHYLRTDIVPMLDQMENSSFAAVRTIGIRLRLLHRVVNAPRNIDSALRTTENYLRQREEHGKVDAGWSDNHFILSFSNWWLGSSAIDDRLEKYRKSLKSPSLQERVNELSRKLDWNGLLEIADDLRCEQQKRLAELHMDHLYSGLANCFAGTGKLPEKAWIFFRRINVDFSICTQSLEELFNADKPLQAIGAIRHADNILLVLTDGDTLSLGSWDLVGKTARQYRLSVAPALFDGLYSENLGAKNLVPWDADDRHAALALKNGDLLLYDFEKKCENILSDRLPASARGLAISGNRIFILCGDRGTSRRNFLISCDFSGENSRIHFSNLRSEKQHEMEISSGELNSLIAFEKGWLYFLLSDTTVKLYGLQVEQNRLEIICDLGNTAFDDRMFLSDGTLYTQTDGHGFRICRIDLQQKKAIPVLMQNQRDETQRVPFCKSWMVQGPFVRRGDLLFGGGLWATTVVDLKNPADSPPLLMPPTGFLLSGLNNEIIYFCQNRYFALSPRKKQ